MTVPVGMFVICRRCSTYEIVLFDFFRLFVCLLSPCCCHNTTYRRLTGWVMVTTTKRVGVRARACVSTGVPDVR